MDGLTETQRLKLEIIERGIQISPAAGRFLTSDGARPLVEPDYVTTGGLTLALDELTYVNAPVGQWFCDQPVATLDVSASGNLELRVEERVHQVQALPLPSYLHSNDAPPRGLMTHADRIRISPIDGCASRCGFCDWPLISYGLVNRADLISGLRVALEERDLPARHVLVSGGTPVRNDESWLEQVYADVVRASPLPVDVMLMPRSDPATIARLVAAGVHGFSVNLELFSPEASSRYCPNKHHLGLEAYASTLEAAVRLTGGNGRVRSLLLVGIENPEHTLDGVNFIAGLGADPVLSPFRPAPGTDLADRRPPSAAVMEKVFLAAREITDRHGVKLGPRCIPCMHNTIAFPDDSGDYYFS